MTYDMRDKTCVVGVGNTAYGNFPETDAYGLGCDALNAALNDSGLTAADIDGLIVHRIPSYERFAEMFGLSGQTYGAQLPSSGRMSSISIMMAAMVLEAGEANCIALVYGNNGRSVRDYYGGGASLWAPWGFTSPGAKHALMARRHMELYGTTSEHFGHVAKTVRDHACLNPQAVMQKSYTIEEHQASRYIAEPLHLLDYCLINDGAVAIIMTRADRAKDLKKPPVYISGFARNDTYANSSIYGPVDDLWYNGLQDVSSRVYSNAGIAQDEVDGLMIYDNFSPTIVFSLEGMGICPKGEGGPFAADGNLKLGSRWPTNTNGGHLSESYMQGWGLLAESVRQCRHECGERQIENVNAIQYIGATPISSSIIFRR